MSHGVNQGPIFLDDKTKSGKTRPWKEKKESNVLLSESYKNIIAQQDVSLDEFYRLENKAYRSKWCACYLRFRPGVDGTFKLAEAQFCQISLCPLCAWRKQMKIRSQLSRVMSVVRDEGYRFFFLTLTCKNPSGDELISTLNMLYKAFDKLFRRKKVKAIAEGFFRALEITHDADRKISSRMYRERKDYYDKRNLKIGDNNPNFGKFHPHFHVMVVVKPDYFKKAKKYINHGAWQDMWQQSLGVDYSPQVNIKAVAEKDCKGILEVAKYTVKDSDYIIKENKPLTDDVVRVLTKAMHRRRLISYGGIMAKIHKALNLDEEVTADVVVDGTEVDDEERKGDDGLLEFRWHIGYKNYVMVRD
jgi:plasmid rolling circle replication initiator protein Rep